MLTKLRVKNFKRLDDVEVEFGDVVVFIGPNNGGKTSALQALLLWNAGLSVWSSERKADSVKRPGVTMPRLGLTQIPVGDAKHLWRNLKVRNVQRGLDSKQVTENILIDIVVDGETAGKAWSCGLEFDYANSESFYCRPMRLGTTRMDVPDLAKRETITLLPPLSGISTDEPEYQPGRVSVLLGEGRSGEVLRNLCLTVFEGEPARWERVKKGVQDVFGIIMLDPKRDKARGVIHLNYRERAIEYPITSGGSGFKQVLLLLAYLEGHPNSTVLLDEPDAHLEVLRQRQVYSLISEAARQSGNQIIIASHSEVVMQEAIDRDVLIGFVGKPRRMDDRGSQIGKALKNIRADDYYQAERKGCVIYLEGSTDLAILRGFAKILDHAALKYLSDPFVFYVANQPMKVLDHFHGLRTAVSTLKSFSLFDRLDRPLPDGFEHQENHIWNRREIENYLALPSVLLRYALSKKDMDLVEAAESLVRIEAMKKAIGEVESALETLGEAPWSPDTKVSDQVLDRIFKRYFEHMNLSNRMSKTDYHVLVDYMQPNEVDVEVIQVLDKIVRMGNSATELNS